MKQTRNFLMPLALVICAIAMPAHAQDKLRLTIANGIAPTIPTHWWFTDLIGPQRWYTGSPTAWAAVNGTYDPALARRALQEQGQSELIKKLEAVKAL